MNYDQLTGILRAIVPPLVAFLAAKNVIPADPSGLWLSAAVAVAAAIWSVFNNQSGKVIQPTISGNPPVNINTPPPPENPNTRKG
jgi:hypothetical protein